MDASQKYKLAIVGSRTFNDRDLMWKVLDSAKDMISEVVSGGARGADTLGVEWANLNGIPATVIRPDWDKHGKGAGFKRNIEIVKSCDKLICFWDGQSKGCANSVDNAIRLQKPYYTIIAPPLPDYPDDDIPF